jgi:hypothetical protein
MPVDTKTIQGRRVLAFHSLDEIVADAERLVASPNTKMLGNWPLGRLLAHLATAINQSIDGMRGQAPWVVRFIARFLKGRILTKGMSAGFKLPEKREADLYPTCESPREGLDKLRTAVGRVRTERMTSPHPVFGRMTHEEWLQLHLRHAEMHLSFAVPG